MQRVVRGQHALHFDCDFFSEKYVEYCFVYVSQAISGAVADVRMDCLPTLPVRGKCTTVNYEIVTTYYVMPNHLIVFFANNCSAGHFQTKLLSRFEITILI